MPRENNLAFRLDALAEDVGQRLREERQRQNLSRKELAALAGISHSTIAHVERGDQRPYPDTLRSLAKAMSVPLVAFAPEWEKAEAARPKSGAAHPGVGLRALRKEKGLTLAALAAASGLKISTLSRLERGLHTTRKVASFDAPGISNLNQLGLIHDKLATELGFENAEALTVACAEIDNNLPETEYD